MAGAAVERSTAKDGSGIEVISYPSRDGGIDKVHKTLGPGGRELGHTTIHSSGQINKHGSHDPNNKK